MNTAKGNGHDLAKGQPADFQTNCKSTADFQTNCKSTADFASTELQRKEKFTFGARLGLEVIHG